MSDSTDAGLDVPDVARASSPLLEGLRDERRARVFEAMAAEDLDALLLGREANVAYATGAHRLWVAGARPFAPVAVLVGASRAVHVIGMSGEGLPDEPPLQHAHFSAWDPGRVGSLVRTIPGVAAARRV